MGVGSSVTLTPRSGSITIQVPRHQISLSVSGSTPTLRSNGVGGLQISTDDGVWVPVTPHPHSAFCVNVGDVLQAMTNGRFLSVKHRAMVSSYDPRMSVAYFAAPSLDAAISCLPGLATLQKPSLYRSFTWAEYKKATYTLRLGDNRLNLFKRKSNDDLNIVGE